MLLLTIDKAGRIIVPKPLRNDLQLEEGDVLEIKRVGDGLMLRPARDHAPLVKSKGIWVYSAGGEAVTAEEVNTLLETTRKERDDSLYSPKS